MTLPLEALLQQQAMQSGYAPKVGDVTHLSTLGVIARMYADRFVLGRPSDLRTRFQLCEQDPNEIEWAMEEMTRYGWIKSVPTGGVSRDVRLPVIEGAFRLSLRPKPATTSPATTLAAGAA